MYLVVFTAVTFLGSCTKAYLNQTNSSTNSSTDPLNPKLLSFDWSGSAPMSAVITYADGSSVNWQADAGSVAFNYSFGYNIFSGTVGGKKKIGVWLGGIYPGNSYPMGLHNGSQYIEYADSNSVPNNYLYWSYNAPFYSGGVYIIRSDTFAIGVAGYMQGLFYGEVVDAVGRKVNISNGYFYFQKW